MRPYKDRFLLSSVMHFPVNGLQNAINGFLFEKECSYTYVETGSEHLSTRAVKYDLNFTSLPWILCVVAKPGKCCYTISEIHFKLQLMNVNFTLSDIIWGDAKTHFIVISVGMNREEHIHYDGMASHQMVILQHDQSFQMYQHMPSC